MKLLLSLIISVGSILIAGIIILYYGKGNGLVGSGWVLSILGAPITFLDLLFSRFLHSFISNFISVLFLYLLQYQLLAFLVYRSTNLNKLICSFVALVIILSALLMWYLCVGKYTKRNHPIYGTTNIQNSKHNMLT